MGVTSTAVDRALETTLQSGSWAPDHTTALDSRFLDADGFPTAGFYALRTIDRFLDARIAGGPGTVLRDRFERDVPKRRRCRAGGLERLRRGRDPVDLNEAPR